MRAWVIPCYNPAALQRDLSRGPAVKDRLQLVLDRLNKFVPPDAEPHVVPLRGPQPGDAGLVSLDIETYGLFKKNADGEVLPPQTVFHPERSLLQDKVPLKDLVLTAAITLPKQDFAPEDLSAEVLGGMAPGETFLFRLDRARDRLLLRKWIDHAWGFMGSHFQYDALCLRRVGFTNLDRTKMVLDLLTINYLHCEIREDRGLKSLGPVLGEYSYDDMEVAKDEKVYDDPRSKGAQQYNCRDTHRTILGIAALSRRIMKDYPASNKLNRRCLGHQSNTVWSCISMSEAGVPFSFQGLLQKEKELRLRKHRAAEVCRRKYGVRLEGKGSDTMRRLFVNRCIDTINDLLLEKGLPGILEDRNLELTEKKKEVAFSDTNRNLFSLYLPKNHELQRALKQIARFSSASKILGTYIYPLVYHRKTDHSDRRSVCLTPSEPGWVRPLSPEQQMKLGAGAPRVPPRSSFIAFPSWWAVPSQGEISSDQGGTPQSRITCKFPALQTMPREIKSIVTSRFPGGVVISDDLSQAELRVPAVMSGEPTLVDNFLRGGDLHTERAKVLFGEDCVTKPNWKTLYRQPAKMVNFADLFWATAWTMMRNVLKDTGLLIPYEVFLSAERDRPKLRPVLWQWQKSLVDEVIRKGFIELPFLGQSRMFVGPEDVIVRDYASTIVNFPVQTTAANVLKEISFGVEKRLYDRRRRGSRPVVMLNVFDSLFVDSPPKDVDRCVEAINDAVHEVEEEGYWSDLIREYGSPKIPLGHDMTLKKA